MHAYTSAIYKMTDAHGDLLRGLQVVETAIGITSNLLGDKLEGQSDTIFFISLNLSSVSRDMDTYTHKRPLGVCASIAPFNFPA